MRPKAAEDELQRIYSLSFLRQLFERLTAVQSYDQYPVIEMDKLDELKTISLPDEPPLMLTLLDIYFTESPVLYKNLVNSLEEGNFADIQKFSHKLSGSCGNFGGIRMTEICRQLERFSVSQDLTGARGLLDILESAYAEFSAILKQELDLIS